MFTHTHMSNLMWTFIFRIWLVRYFGLMTEIKAFELQLIHLANEASYKKMSRGMRFPTMWYVRPAQPQISLRIRAVWSEPLLVTCLFHKCLATNWTTFGDSKLKRRLHRLVWVYTCQKATLLEISYHGSNLHTCNLFLVNSVGTMCMSLP